MLKFKKNIIVYVYALELQIGFKKYLTPENTKTHKNHIAERNVDFYIGGKHLSESK